MSYRWPEFSTLFGKLSDRVGFDSKSYFFRQYIRFTLRNLLARKQINPFVEFINQNPRRIALFSKHIGAAHWLLCKDFLNKRFSHKQRAQSIAYNLEVLEQILSDELFSCLLQGEEIEILRLEEDLSCIFVFNGALEEGFLAIKIIYKSQVVYHLSFGFVQEDQKPALLIACIQGGGNGENLRVQIKEVTKKLFGLRPQNFLIEIARFFAQYLGLQYLFGISQEQQIRYSRFGKKRYFAEYNQMWEECGGALRGQYYDLSEVKQKDLSEIPSQKRSMYKKRFALLEDSKEKVFARLKEIGVRECL